MKFEGGGSERIKNSDKALMLSRLLPNVTSLILCALPPLYFDDMSDTLDVEFHRFSIGVEAVLWLLCASPCPRGTKGRVPYMALLFDSSAELVTTVTSRSI